MDKCHSPLYQQTYGTAMGSPVSVTVADLVMEDVEERALSTCTHKPLFWKRYVDDTLSALPPDQIQAFHHHLNSIEPSIQFTIEEESQGTIAFLDTVVTRHDDGSLSTTVFRKKKTHRPLSGLFISPPPSPQGCSDSDPANQGRQDLHLPM